MGVVEGILPNTCPHCGKMTFQKGWKCIQIGNEVQKGSSYNMGKGIVGGLLGFGAGFGFAHSKGSLKSERIDLYECPFCKQTVRISTKTFW